MHSLNTIIRNNQKAVDKHLADAKDLHAQKVSPSTLAQNEALAKVKANG